MARTIHVGEMLPELTKGPVTRQMLVEWCAAENDYYPLHFDERLAAQMKLPGIPIQGTFRYALLGQMLGRWMASMPGGNLARMSVSYRGLDLEGDTITARGCVLSCEPLDSACTVTIEVWIDNSRGESSTRGAATVSVPRVSDR